MTMDPVIIAEYVGIVSFSFSGVAVGVRAKMDVFGLLFLGFVTALGGGVTRDVILNKTPMVFVETEYIVLALGAAIVAIALRPFDWNMPDIFLKTLDSVGTGAFAVTGVLIGSSSGLNWMGILLLGMITATGGGIVRDILASRIPRVLSTELNATGALVGGSATYLLLEVNEGTATIVGGFITALIVAIGHMGWFRVPRVEQVSSDSYYREAFSNMDTTEDSSQKD